MVARIMKNMVKERVAHWSTLNDSNHNKMM